MNILPSLIEPSPHTFFHMGASLIHKLLSYRAHSLCTHPKPARERVKSMYQFHFQSSRLVGAQPLKPVGRRGNFPSGASVMYVNENQFISRNTFLSLFSSSVSVMYFTANLLAH